MEYHEQQEMKDRERFSGFADALLIYCEEQFGPARDDLNERLQRADERKALANMLLQRLAWIATIVGASVAIYNFLR